MGPKDVVHALAIVKPGGAPESLVADAEGILRGAGLSPARIAGTVFKAGVALLVIMLCVQSFVAPPLLQRAQQMRASAITGGSIRDINLESAIWNGHCYGSTGPGTLRP